MRDGVRVIVGSQGKLSKAMRVLTSQVVLVGIPADSPTRPIRQGERRLPPTNAVLGYIHEFGSPARNIPARPFLFPGIDAARDRLVDDLKKTAVEVLRTSKVESATQGLYRVGLIGETAVKARITSGPHTPLSPRTLEARRRRGNPSDKPLIDMGALRRSVTFVVVGRSDARAAGVGGTPTPTSGAGRAGGLLAGMRGAVARRIVGVR